MTHLLAPDMDPKTGLPNGKKSLNLPALYSVILSLPRAYTLMRISRIVNERMSSPFMKYEPAFSSDQNRLYGDVLTQRVDVMNRDFGFTATFAQAVQGAAKYGQQIQFLQEEWFSRPDYSDGPKAGKEGLRYTLPHPSRTYYDLNHPLWTLNTGTGCRYAGYWRITSCDERTMYVSFPAPPISTSPEFVPMPPSSVLSSALPISVSLRLEPTRFSMTAS